MKFKAGDKVESKVTGYCFEIVKFKTNIQIDDVVILKGEREQCIPIARSYFEENFKFVE